MDSRGQAAEVRFEEVHTKEGVAKAPDDRSWRSWGKGSDEKVAVGS